MDPNKFDELPNFFFFFFLGNILDSQLILIILLIIDFLLRLLVLSNYAVSFYNPRSVSTTLDESKATF